MNYEKWKTKDKVLSHWVDEGCCCEVSQVTGRSNEAEEQKWSHKK